MSLGATSCSIQAGVEKRFKTIAARPRVTVALLPFAERSTLHREVKLPWSAAPLGRLSFSLPDFLIAYGGT